MPESKITEEAHCPPLVKAAHLKSRSLRMMHAQSGNYAGTFITGISFPTQGVQRRDALKFTAFRVEYFIAPSVTNTLQQGAHALPFCQFFVES